MVLLVVALVASPRGCLTLSRELSNLSCMLGAKIHNPRAFTLSSARVPTLEGMSRLDLVSWSAGRFDVRYSDG